MRPPPMGSFRVAAVVQLAQTRKECRHPYGAGGVGVELYLALLPGIVVHWLPGRHAVGCLCRLLQGIGGGYEYQTVGSGCGNVEGVGHVEFCLAWLVGPQRRCGAEHAQYQRYYM